MNDAHYDTENETIPQKPHKRHWTVSLLVWILINLWKIIASIIIAYLIYRYALK